MRRVLLLIGAAILALGFLLAIGYLYQARAMAADLARYQPPGEIVTVKGIDLHIFCQGNGTPTVVVDAGNGDFSLSWRQVQTEVASFARICTYDRAGYAWSKSSPHDRSARQVAEELHALLQGAEEPGPYIMVGHSLGGLHMRMYAALYPNDVAGMVLVDAAHEDQWDRFPPEYRQFVEQQETQMRALELLARFGLLRAMGHLPGAEVVPEQVQKLPDHLQDQYLAMIARPSYFAAVLDEVESLAQTSQQVRGTGDLGETPLVVLTAGQALPAEALEQMELTIDQIQPIWMEMQEELVTLSANSTHRIVPDSGHHIHLDRPDMVVDAIRSVFDIVSGER